MRKVLIPVLCGILAILSMHLYGMFVYVSEIDAENDMVRFTDYATEHEYWWEGVDGRELYDNAVLVMFDWFTAENVADDQIVTVTEFRYNAEFEYVKGAN